MAETLFALDRHNYRECQTLFRGNHNQEYYLGDYWIEDGNDIDVRATRRAAGPASIILLRSVSRLFFRRTRQHIREDLTDLTVLWFVRRGKLVYSDQSGRKTAQPGDFLLTRSTTPFFIECQTDDDGLHDVLHVTVPSHKVRGHVGHLPPGGLLLRRRAEPRIMRDMLSSLFEGGDDLGEGTCRAVAEAVCAITGDMLRATPAAVPQRLTLAERRYQDVLRFIEVHLCDPHLSTLMIARGCGISPRYLSALLHQNHTSFSRLIWERRLEQARDWIGHGGPAEVSISEIAYAVGFKSPAHFSRMFKRTYQRNPSEYRADALAMAPDRSAMPAGPSPVAGIAPAQLH